MAAQNPAHRPRLTLLWQSSIDARPTLPEAFRAGIMAMVLVSLWGFAFAEVGGSRVFRKSRLASYSSNGMAVAPASDGITLSDRARARATAAAFGFSRRHSRAALSGRRPS
jgi:hypothetical protein